MSDEKAQAEPTLVQKWIEDQQEWHKMATEYFDSMVKHDDFLVHLGNAMRGSLLAGKPYPGAEPPAEGEDKAAATDDRIDEILHALHKLQGEVADLKMTLDDLASRYGSRAGSQKSATPTAPTPKSFNRGAD